MPKKILELYTGSTAGKVAGYENRPSFKYTQDRYPIPDQGYRVNGKPAWTRQHLEAWRASIPAPGIQVKKS